MPETTPQPASDEPICSVSSDFEKGPWSYDLYADGLQPVALLNDLDQSQGEWVDIEDYRRLESELNEEAGFRSQWADKFQKADAAHEDAWSKYQELREAVKPVIAALANLSDTDDWRGVGVAMVRCHALLDKFPDLASQNSVDQRTPLRAHWSGCTCDYGCDGRAPLRGEKCQQCRDMDRFNELTKPNVAPGAILIVDDPHSGRRVNPAVVPFVESVICKPLHPTLPPMPI